MLTLSQNYRQITSVERGNFDTCFWNSFKVLNSQESKPWYCAICCGDGGDDGGIGIIDINFSLFCIRATHAYWIEHEHSFLPQMVEREKATPKLKGSEQKHF